MYIIYITKWKDNDTAKDRDKLCSKLVKLFYLMKYLQAQPYKALEVHSGI